MVAMGSAGRSGSGFSDSDVIRWIQKKEGGRIIETIADNCGFSSASHFIMAFRKSTGITPHQYRTQWK